MFACVCLHACVRVLVCVWMLVCVCGLGSFVRLGDVSSPATKPAHQVSHAVKALSCVSTVMSRPQVSTPVVKVHWTQCISLCISGGQGNESKTFPNILYENETSQKPDFKKKWLLSNSIAKLLNYLHITCFFPPNDQHPPVVVRNIPHSIDLIKNTDL